MKIKKIIRNFSTTLLLAASLPFGSQAQILKKLKDKVNQTIDRKTDKAVDNTVNKTDKTVEDGVNKAIGKDGKSVETNNSDSKPATTPPATDGKAAAPTIAAYKNYDFVPGDKIIFEDHFDTDEEGEFPAHWKLVAGQSNVNTFNDKRVLLLTGYYTTIIPAIKTPAYLTDSFSIEFDNYSINDFGPQIWFYKTVEDAKSSNAEQVKIIFNERNGFYTLNIRTKDHQNEQTVRYPEAIGYDKYRNKWHHIAIAYKAKRLKIYVDEYRVLSIPELDLNATALAFIGDGTPKDPVIITNFKLAQGAGIKTQDTKFTDTKIVTHGINFDINKADIKPESMGTINAIVAILKSNSDLKFEIQGHTDNSGNAANNLTLSQKRADEVKRQMVALGIDETRLTTKGFGDTKPMSDNGTPEGKANNRRVEFIRL
jgi:outer membrane protein OmpA-like peptidoglycan-associated protein